MTSAWGRGLATVTDDDVVLDTWFSEVGLGDDTATETFARYEAAQRRDDLRGVHIRAVRLTTPLKVDGRLDEAIYSQVQPVSGFQQIEPNAGKPATQQTEFWEIGRAHV